jgi:hypothetical protein
MSEPTYDEILAQLEAEDGQAKAELITDPAMQDLVQPADVSKEAIIKQLDEMDQYEGRGLEAAPISAADSATLGLSSQLLKQAGVYSAEELSKLREHNEAWDTVGSVAGIVGPAVASGGTSLVAKGAAKVAAGPALAAIKAGQVVEKSIMKALASSGEKKIAREVLAKSLAKGAGGAVEGAAFGAGQLIRENALGEADFNAENLLAHAGTGALYGGLLTAAVPVLGQAATGSKKLFKDLSGKIFDKDTALSNLMGMSPKQFAKISKNDDLYKVFEEAPQEMQDYFGINFLKDGAETRYKKLVIDGFDKAGKDIDKMVPALQEMATQKGVLPSNYSIYTDLSTAAYRMAKEYADHPDFKHVADKLYNRAEFYANRARRPGGIRLSELRDERIRMDKIAKDLYKSGAENSADGAKRAYETRRLISDQFNNIAERVDPLVHDQWRKANQRFQIASMFAKGAESKAFSKKKLFDSIDFLMGAGAALNPMAGGIITAIAGTKKLVQSDLANRFVVLGAIEKAQQSSKAKIGSAIDNFFKQKKGFARPALVKTMLNSPLARNQEKNEAPKNKQEAYKNVSKNLQELNGNPEKLMERTVKAGAVISKHAPDTALLVGDRLVRATQFLAKKMPKPIRETTLLPNQKDYTPSTIELAKFERYVQAVDHPLSVLEDFENGTVTREHIEAIQEVYPKLYQQVRQTAFNRMRDVTDPLPYNKVIQLSILLNLPGDDSLLGKNIKALQENLKPGEEQAAAGQPMVNSTQGGAAEVDMAAREASDTQAFINRRNGQ